MSERSQADQKEILDPNRKAVQGKGSIEQSQEKEQKFPLSIKEFFVIAKRVLEYAFANKIKHFDSEEHFRKIVVGRCCLLYTSPSPRD